MRVDQELIRRCAQGDSAAYRTLVEQLEKPLVNFIYRFVGERHTAEDIFQETFVRVVRTVANFRPEASLTTWIYTIARNLSLDHLKARRRHREVPIDAPSADREGKLIYFRDALRSNWAGPGTKAESQEDEERVARALSALTPAKREALSMRLYADLPYADIARIVNAPVGTIKFRVHEAVHDIARMLGDDEGENPAAVEGGAS